MGIIFTWISLAQVCKYYRNNNKNYNAIIAVLAKIVVRTLWGEFIGSTEELGDYFISVYMNLIFLSTHSSVFLRPKSHWKNIKGIFLYFRENLYYMMDC